MSLSADWLAYPRRTSYSIAKYTVSEGTFRDLIKNIGVGGLFFRLRERLPKDRPL